MTRRTHILVCPDSFKGTLSAIEAANAMTRGIRRVMRHAEISILPMADGGEGSVEALATGTRGRMIRIPVRGPLGEPTKATLLFLPEKTAVVEMAQAAGLLLTPPDKRNPLKASTYGVGQMIAVALKRGSKNIIVFTGGSATTDGGAGMAQALGVRLLDEHGKAIPPGGAGLLHLAHIDALPLRSRLHHVSVLGATDVLNPLLGKRGSARNFSPQKGATPGDVKILEKGLTILAKVVKKDMGMNIRSIPGSGSAGGTGAGLVAFLEAALVPGAPLVFDILNLDRHLAGASLVLTGEGSLDHQTSMGKLISQLCRRARQHRVPVIAFAGRMTLSPGDIKRLGLAGAHRLTANSRDSMRRAGFFLERKVAEVLAGGPPRPPALPARRARSRPLSSGRRIPPAKPSRA